MLGTLFVVATPIGNLEDITARALRVLREVALIAAEDTRHTMGLLAKFGITTPTTSLHEHNEFRKSGALLGRLRSGDDVALVSDAGTPTVSDPGHRLIRAALEAGVPVVPIPGPCAAIAALSVSGFPGSQFLFLGFPPVKPAERRRWFEDLKQFKKVTVFFEAPHRIEETLQTLQLELGDIPILVGRELTKAHEELVYRPISMALKALSTSKGEFVCVIDVGQATKNGAAEISDERIVREFELAFKQGRLTKRQAAAKAGRILGLSTNRVYSAVERAGKSA